MKIIKRREGTENFDKNKITAAILKAMENGSGIVKEEVAIKVGERIEKTLSEKDVKSATVQQIEVLVYNELVKEGQYETAKAYEGFRAVQAFKRQFNTTDKDILDLVSCKNVEVMNENSNKNARILPTQRDLIAGEISKDMARRKLIPTQIVQAHDNGTIHFHDMDYFLQPMFNCCLVNLGDMLDNGTVINGNLVESPKSFQVSCTVMTQIIAQIASGQYGGQSINVKHLGKYLRRSYDKYLEMFKSEKNGVALAKELTMKELKDGVQTIQYQINTLMTTNGQSPFVTLFLELPQEHEYKEEIALIIEEILEQRLKGIKNEKGAYTTPSFPKLVYVLDEHNSLNGGEYDYITKLAAKCSAKRLYPDYISAKRMKDNYEGNVFPPMGCRSFLSPWYDEAGEVKFEGRFNQGVVSLNLPQIGILAKGNEEDFWSMLEQRLNLCKEALLIRHESLLGTPSDVSPIHWQHGGIARLEKGEVIDKLLKGGYSTLSLGYIGLYELTYLMTGESHTSEAGAKFALKVMNRMKEVTVKWKAETGLGFALYGTPAESLCYRFAKIDERNFGTIENVTDKGYYTNSYHVDVREKISAFDKLNFESQFQGITTGGCISYIEIPNMNHNLEAMEDLIRFFYDNIQYAEFNTKSDYCHVCDWDGEIIINDNCEWECPACGNKDTAKMNVTRRTCGYLGSNLWNLGKTKEIKLRELHL